MPTSVFENLDFFVDQTAKPQAARVCRIVAITLLLFITSCHKSNPAPPTAADLNSPAYWLNRAETEVAGCTPEQQCSIETCVAKGFAGIGDVEHFRVAVGKAEELNKALDAKEQAVFPEQVAVAYLQIGDRDAFNGNVAAACTGSSYGNYGIVHELIRQGLLDDAANIAEMAKLSDERADRFETLAVEMAKAGRRSDYEKFIEKATGETTAAITATTQPADREYLAFLLCNTEFEAGDYERVLKSIDGLKAQHALTLYAEIAAARFKAGDTAEYGKLIDHAVKLASSDRYASCQAIGKAMALANDEPRVQQARVAMGRRSVEIEFFLERARMFAETGDADNALQCLKKADAGIAKDDAPDWASVPSQISHTAVMEALAKAGKDDAALAMVPNLKSILRVDSPAEPEMTYPLIAAAQAAGGRITAARATMEKVPDPAKRESNVPAVCNAAAEAGQPLDDIRVWIDSFQKPLNRADADIRVAYALIKRQKGK